MIRREASHSGVIKYDFVLDLTCGQLNSLYLIVCFFFFRAVLKLVILAVCGPNQFGSHFVGLHFSFKEMVDMLSNMEKHFFF